MECFSYKGEAWLGVDVRVSSHLKEELAWAVGKWRWGLLVL